MRAIATDPCWLVMILGSGCHRVFDSLKEVYKQRRREGPITHRLATGYGSACLKPKNRWTSAAEPEDRHRDERSLARVQDRRGTRPDRGGAASGDCRVGGVRPAVVEGDGQERIGDHGRETRGTCRTRTLPLPEVDPRSVLGQVPTPSEPPPRRRLDPGLLVARLVAEQDSSDGILRGVPVGPWCPMDDKVVGHGSPSTRNGTTVSR